MGYIWPHRTQFGTLVLCGVKDPIEHSPSAGHYLAFARMDWRKGESHVLDTELREQTFRLAKNSDTGINVYLCYLGLSADKKTVGFQLSWL